VTTEDAHSAREFLVDDFVPAPHELLSFTDWAAVKHALGVADDVPTALDQILHDDPAARARALCHLEESVHHSSTIYPATAPVALHIAAILADPRTDAAGIYRRNDTRRPLRAALLDWLGDMAADVGDDAVAIMERFGYTLDNAPAMIALRATRPVIFDAVLPFLHDGDLTVRDAAVTTAVLLIGPNAARAHDELRPLVREVLDTSTFRYHRARAIDTLNAWGEETPRLEPLPSVGTWVTDDPWAPRDGSERPEADG
jgi:hypothetical protein